MIEEQFGRLKGASWFTIAHKKPVLILGIGGIGSNLAYNLARIGCELHLFDSDSVEFINLAGQMYKQSDIGKNKGFALKDTLRLFSPATDVFTNNKYEVDSMTNDIVFCGFDNMEARKLAFDNWVAYTKLEEVDESKCYFCDGRLTSQLLQIYSIPGNKQDLIDKYQKESLFNDSVVEELDCTFKQTTFVASLIAGFMTSFFTNWLSNVYTDINCNEVPYFFQYFTPLNITQIDNL